MQQCQRISKLPFRVPVTSLREAKVTQSKMRKHEFRIEIKRALERLRGCVALPLFLLDRGEQIMRRGIELVGGDCLLAPLDCLGEFALVGA